METDPVLHYVVDIRSADQRMGQPLPQDLQQALHIPGGAAHLPRCMLACSIAPLRSICSSCCQTTVPTAACGSLAACYKRPDLAMRNLCPLSCAGDKLRQVLSDRFAWNRHFARPSEEVQAVAYPSPEHLLVFVGDSEQETSASAAAAAALGFTRSVVLRGGLAAYSADARKQVGGPSCACHCVLAACSWWIRVPTSAHKVQSRHVRFDHWPIQSEETSCQGSSLLSAWMCNQLPSVAAAKGCDANVAAASSAARHGCRVETACWLLQADLHFIDRDALAALLGHVDVGAGVRDVTVLDLRRDDERALYGTIPGKLQPLACTLLRTLQTVQNLSRGMLVKVEYERGWTWTVSLYCHWRPLSLRLLHVFVT